jgi:uncharacterized membrane protein
MSFVSPSSSLKLTHRRSGASQQSPRERQRLRKSRFMPLPEALETRTALSAGYVFSTIDDPSAGKTGSSLGVQGTFVLGINDHGQITGNYGDSSDETHGFRLNHGKYATLNDPEAGTVAGPPTFFPGTDAVGSNDKGQIVGFYIDANNVEHSFLESNGHFTTIDPPGAANHPGPSFTANDDQAANINDRGEIVGGYSDASGITHGYLLNHGHYTILNDPNGTFTFATGINDRGQIVGFYFDSQGVEHGFMLSRGRYTTLSDPSAGTEASQGTLGFMINNSGEVAGWYTDSSGATHGFAFSQGQYTTLDDPDGVGTTYAERINDRGVIAGFYFDSSGLAHGFLATPGHGH